MPCCIVFVSVMVEGHGKEVSEDVFCEAVRVGMDGVSYTGY